MTLLITAATKDRIYISSDYRLSNGNTIVKTENGAKQLNVSNYNWFAQISFTGIAFDGYGYNSISWLKKVLSSVTPETTINQLNENILQSGTMALNRVRGNYNGLTIIVAVSEFEKCRLFVISNFESPYSKSKEALNGLKLYEVNVGKPQILVYGSFNKVPKEYHKQIMHLLKTDRNNYEKISNLISKTNIFVSQKAPNLISQECWISSMSATGKEVGKNYGVAQGLPSNYSFSTDAIALLSKEFPELGKLKLLTSAYARPLNRHKVLEIGKPRLLQISCSDSDFIIKKQTSDEIIARVHIQGTKNNVTISKNLEATSSFGLIKLEVNFQQLIDLESFEYKRQVFTCIPTIDGVNPHNWGYALDIKYCGSVFAVHFSQLSMAFRSANLSTSMPILENNEELVMVAARSGINLSASHSKPSFTANLDVTFLLRDFPELDDN